MRTGSERHGIFGRWPAAVLARMGSRTQIRLRFPVRWPQLRREWLARRRLPGVVLGFALTFVSIATMGQTSDFTARQTVERATEKILEVLRVNEQLAESDPESFYKAVDAVFGPYIDYRGVARGIMAAYYRQASVEQKRDFVEKFKWGLIRTYARFLLLVDRSSIRIGAERPPTRGGRFNIVDMTAGSLSGRSFRMDYSMVRTKDGRWLTRNLTVNGINLGLTYRQQFAKAMEQGEYKGDMDDVIANWTQDAVDVSTGE